jgi:hypothetical protein
MSEKNALTFMQQFREGQLQIPSIDPYTNTLEDVSAIAAQHGLEFTAEELRIAFKRRWAEQWLKSKSHAK